MVGFAITHLVSGGIITNYSCTSKCRHCLYNCSPSREKQYIDPQTAEKNFRIVRSLGCRSVHIGGGEPFLSPEKLGKVLEAAGTTDVSIDYIETNSSWYQDSNSAHTVLSGLHEKGLNILLVSISPFHNEYIPFSKVKGVMATAESIGIEIYPWVSGFISDLTELDPLVTHKLSEFEERFGPFYLPGILQRYWIHMGGRALDTFRTVSDLKTCEQILSENRYGCSGELSDTSHFHLDLFGNYIPGLCSGLSISGMDLGKSIPDQTYPLISTLSNEGINGLYDLAGNKYGYAPLKQGYINKCDLCTEIRTFLFAHTSETFPELTPVGFYT